MNQPIRILQVVTIMNLGGIENFLMTLYRHIDRTRIQFDFLVHRQERGAFDDEIEALGGNIYRMDALQPLKYITYRLQLMSLFKAHPEYQIVHAHLNANSTLVLSVAKKMGVKVRIAHAHNTMADKNRLLKNILKRRLKYHTTFNYACSIDAGKWLYGSYEEFHIFHNSIDADAFGFKDDEAREKVRMKLKIDKNEIVIGNVAGFSPQKNHAFLVEIFSAFNSINPAAKLLLIGDGELRGNVIVQIEKLGLKDKVLFTGAVKNANEYLNAMDVVVFPSLYEGLPLSLVEAQCNGLPILLSETIAKEIDLTDLICRKSLADTKEDWAEKIQKILQKYKGNDRSRYKQEIIKKNYDIRSNVDKLQAFYLAEYNKLKPA